MSGEKLTLIWHTKLNL